jgi:DNA-binding NarL/FixJ family response regulator
MSTEVKQQLDWRRSKVLELSSQGYSEREISEILKVSDSSVHRDLVFVRQHASISSGLDTTNPFLPS